MRHKHEAEHASLAHELNLGHCEHQHQHHLNVKHDVAPSAMPQPGKPSHRPSDAVLRSHALRRFRQVDKDGSGRLEREELRSLCTSLGRTTLRDDELDAVLAALDKSGTGSVSFDDFFIWFKGGLSLQALLQPETVKLRAATQNEPNMGESMQLAVSMPLNHAMPGQTTRDPAHVELEPVSLQHGIEKSTVGLAAVRSAAHLRNHDAAPEPIHERSHNGKAHHGDEDEMMERSMTEGASKEKPERQFEHRISQKAVAAAIAGSHGQVADGVAERHERLASEHAKKQREAHEHALHLSGAATMRDGGDRPPGPNVGGNKTARASPRSVHV